MSSSTMQRTESRPYDYIYDSTYINSKSSPTKSKDLHNKITSIELSKGRYKYFKQPIALNANKTYKLDLSTNINETKDNNDTTIIEPFAKDVSVQTMYRDTDVQTDPYSPEYVLPTHIQPNILLLEKYKFNNNGVTNNITIEQADIFNIQQLQYKQQIYANLPPFTDESNVLLRKLILESYELHEFNIHENEINEQNKVKLQNYDIQRNILINKNNTIINEKLEIFKSQKEVEKEVKMDKFIKLRERELRQIARKRDADPSLTTTNNNNAYSNTNSSTRTGYKSTNNNRLTVTTSTGTADDDEEGQNYDDQEYTYNDDSNNMNNTGEYKTNSPYKNTYNNPTYTTNTTNTAIDTQQPLYRIKNTNKLNKTMNDIYNNKDNDEILDNLNQSLQYNQKLLYSTNTNTNAKSGKGQNSDHFELPKILIPKSSRLTQERMTSAKTRQVRNVEVELDTLYMFIQKEKARIASEQAAAVEAGTGKDDDDIMPI